MDHLDVHEDIRLAGGTALHEAVLRNDVGLVVRLVRDHPQLLDAQTKNGSTPLHLAVLNSSRKIVQHLIASGADFTKQRLSGYTPLHEAAWSGRESAVQALLRAGADPSVKDNGGYTALELARRHRRLGCATLMARRAQDERALAHEAVAEHQASDWREIMKRKTEEGTETYSKLHRIAEEQKQSWDNRRRGGAAPADLTAAAAAPSTSIAGALTGG